mgnify:CR=1 FL=1
MDYVDIKLVIDTDPGTIGVSPAKSDAENANLLNAISGSFGVVKPIPIADFQLYLANNGLRRKIEDDSKNTASGTRDISLTVVDYLVSGRAEFYLLEATLSAILDAYIANSIVFGGFTATDKANFLALVKKDSSYAEFRWGVVISDRDISIAYGRSS